MWHFFADDYVLTVPDASDAVEVAPQHTHHALQLSLRLDEPLRWSVDQQAGEAPVALLIGADVPHHVAGGAALMCEPESDLGRRLLGRLRDERYVILDEAELCALGGFLHRFDDRDADALPGHVGAAIDAVTADCAPLPPLDPRVRRVIERLRAARGRPPLLRELAADVGLSAERLRHLFVQEVGLPIRQYTLWLRSVEAIRAMVESQRSLGTTAHDTGFADQAALSRAHRRFFGRTPSQFSNERHVDARKQQPRRARRKQELSD